MSTRRIGIVRAHAIRLEQLLQLPGDHHVTTAYWDSSTQELRLAIEGDTMPMVEDGQVIPFVDPTVQIGRSTNALLITWPKVKS